MKIIADLHCHTLASTHAYSTVKELIDRASEIGLYALAITDHGPDNEDSPHIWHFGNIVKQIPEEVNGVRVLKGVEANIIDYDGNIDLDNKILASLDIVIASFHKPVIKFSDFDTVTKCMVNIAKNPFIDIVGHCGTPNYAFDYEKIIKLFKENNKVIEINSNTHNIRAVSWENCIKIAKLCKDIGCKVVVNSDCHSIYSLGNFDNAIKLLEGIDFPQKLIINSSVESLEDYLQGRKERIEKHYKNI